MIFKTDSSSKDKIGLLLSVVESDLETISEIKHISSRDSTTLKLCYDVLHSLCEAIIRLYGYKSYNHICLFAFVCKQTGFKEADFNFLDGLRRMRNNLHYVGISQSIPYQSYRTQFIFHVDLFTSYVKDML